MGSRKTPISDGTPQGPDPARRMADWRGIALMLLFIALQMGFLHSQKITFVGNQTYIPLAYRDTLGIPFRSIHAIVHKSGSLPQEVNAGLLPRRLPD